MPESLSFRCQCGTVSGDICGLKPGAGIRFVCCCDDCQVSAITLGHAEMLDAHGGTAAFLVDSSCLEIRTGLQRIAAMRVAEIASRPVVRWFCSTCKTPLFNTYDDARRSFLSVVLANADPELCDRALGPSTGHVWKKFAWGNTRSLQEANMLAMLVRMLQRQASARLTGDFRKTPLFDRRTHKPITAISVLTRDERRRAESIAAAMRGAKQA